MQSNPCDFVPLKEWCEGIGSPVFRSPKMLHYHTFPVQQELIEAGAMAKVGVQIYLHKTEFWPAYQKIIAKKIGGR